MVKEKLEDNSIKSFPNATGALSGAAYIHHRYSLKETVSFYTLATFTAYSRIKHYTNDVIVWAILQ